MTTPLSRRQFVIAAPGLTAAATALFGPFAHATALAADDKPTSTGVLWPDFPRQNPELVREVVGASHRDEAKVRELVDKHPALARATWDWGYGDWESALGAAAHTGRRTIAEYLIEKGARIDIFAAAMLGMTDAVKAMVAASPGIQRTLGPHCIPLLAHAEAGEDKAKPTYDYLQTLGDAGNPPATEPLAEEQRKPYLGRFRFGPGPADEFEVKLDKQSRLRILRPGGNDHMIHYLGDNEFFPAGVTAVRIRFEMKEGQAAALTIIDHGPVVTATRAAT